MPSLKKLTILCSRYLIKKNVVISIIINDLIQLLTKINYFIVFGHPGYPKTLFIKSKSVMNITCIRTLKVKY